ncbi:MAG: hypothetical protein ACOYMP_12980 [Nodosilinea sp.]
MGINPDDISDLDPTQLEDCPLVLSAMATAPHRGISLDKNVVVVHYDSLPEGNHSQIRSSQYHAIYAISGCTQFEATISHGGHCQNLTSDNLTQPFILLIPAGTVYQARWLHPITITGLFLNRDFVQTIAQDLTIEQNLELTWSPISTDLALYHLVCGLRSELTVPTVEQIGPMYQKSLTTALAAQLVKKYSVCPPPSPEKPGFLPPYPLGLVLEYITTHLEAELSLTDLATLIGVSQPELSQIFENLMGVTLPDYIQQQRIQRLDRILQRLKSQIFQPWESAQLPGTAGAVELSRTTGIDRVILWLNQLLLAQAGRSLNDTQTKIVVGILKGERYSEISRRHNQSEGHLKGVASDLWKLLSEVCGEPIRKTNLWSYLRRQGLLED